jgi:cobalt-zinc-cadmium efflux system outer membrane protein
LQWKALTGLAAIPDTPEAIAAANAQMVPDEHPVLRLADFQVDLARKRLNLVNASKLSPPELIARVRQDVGNRGESAVNTLGVAIRIPFGTSDRNEPLMAAAITELEVAEAAQRQQMEQVAAAIEVARSGTLAAEGQLDAERSRAAMLRERATLVEASFRAGESSLPELLRASTAAAQAEVGLARQQAASGLARARLQQALGLLP